MQITGLFSALSDSQLEDEITTWAGRVAAGEARLLLLVGEFDRREAWAGPGLLSCAHWLAWRLGMAPAAARERVRVGRALAELPLVNGAFSTGRLSWTQVRAITRVCQPEDEQQWIDLARHASGAQIEKLARGVRRARQSALDAADPELAAWRMRTRVRYDEDGSLAVTIRATAQDGAVVLAALEAARADIDRRRAQAALIGDVRAEPPAAPPGLTLVPDLAPGGPAAETPRPGVAREDAPPASSASAETPAPGIAAVEPPSSGSASAETSGSSNEADAHAHEPPAPETTDGESAGPPARATLSEAFLELCRATLDSAARDHPTLGRRLRSRLTVQVDPLSGWARLSDGELLPPSTVSLVLPEESQRLLRPGALRPLLGSDLTRFDLGRSRRLPSTQLRDLIGTLDGERCRFPGCTRRHRLHAHHVTYWAAGGPTDLANLVLLCPRHHTLVHAQPFHLTLHPDRTLTVTTRDGTRVLPHPAVPWPGAPGRTEALQLDPALLDAGATIGPGTLPPDAYDDRLDLGYAVMVLLQQAA